jgi:putative Holliday junction resolvase
MSPREASACRGHSELKPPAVSRILAVDWGERRIGLAISDPSGTIATGLETLTVRSFDDGVTRVADLAKDLDVVRVVVGLPLLLSGSRGSAAEAAERFASQLAGIVRVPVETYDERLTSALSERRMREVGRRPSRAKARVDQGAAVALLESFLQSLRHRGSVS